jgi:hypothetical protein
VCTTPVPLIFRYAERKMEEWTKELKEGKNLKDYFMREIKDELPKLRLVTNFFVFVSNLFFF